MKKITPYIGILLLAVGLFTPTTHAHAIFGIEISDVIGDLLSPIGYALMGLAALLTSLGGLLLNAAVYYTIIQMAQTFTDVTAINDAWIVLRDLANMAFIFVILFASIKLILGQGKDTQKLIVNMVVAAILINFSLFFTKVVIDVANLLAVTFYSALAPGPYNDFATAGMANAIMDSLRLTSLFDLQTEPIVNGTNIFTIAIMSSVVLLIATFVFFAISILLIIRYVVLIFVLILSPLMFVSMIVPQLDKYRKQWWNALMGQAFFAPIYFLLTWVTVVVIRGISESTFNVGGSFADALQGASGSVPIIINFLVIIAFLIISLVIAKSVASQAGPQVNNFTKWAMGAAGGVTFGAAGRVGRNVIGSRAAVVANDDNLKRMAAEGSMRARLKLAAADRASKSSFDVRGSKVGGTMGMGSPKKGVSFVSEQKAREKAFGAFRPDTKKATEGFEKADAALKTAQASARTEAEKIIPKSPELVAAEKELGEARSAAERPRSLNDTDEMVASINTRVNEAEEKVEGLRKKHKSEMEEFVSKSTTEAEAGKKRAEENKKEADERMKKMEERERNSGVNKVLAMTGFFASAKDKANAVRSAAKEKSKKEQLADAALAVAKEDEEREGGPKGGGDDKKDGDKKE